MYKYLYRLMLSLYFILAAVMTGIIVYLLGIIFSYSVPINKYFFGEREFGLYDFIFWTVLISISLLVSLSFIITAGRNYLLYDLKFCELLKPKPIK